MRAASYELPAGRIFAVGNIPIRDVEILANENCPRAWPQNLNQAQKCGAQEQLPAGAITSHMRAGRSLNQRTMASKSSLFAVARVAAFLVVGSVAFVVPPPQQVSKWFWFEYAALVAIFVSYHTYIHSRQQVVPTCQP